MPAAFEVLDGFPKALSGDLVSHYSAVRIAERWQGSLACMPRVPSRLLGHAAVRPASEARCRECIEKLAAWVASKGGLGVGERPGSAAAG